MNWTMANGYAMANYTLAIRLYIFSQSDVVLTFDKLHELVKTHVSMLIFTLHKDDLICMRNA